MTRGATLAFNFECSLQRTIPHRPVIPAKRSASRNTARFGGQYSPLQQRRLDSRFRGNDGVPVKKSANNRLYRTGGLDAREALIEALVLVGKSLVIDPKQVQQGGLEVADMNRIFDDVVGELVGFSVDGSALHSATRHP